MLKTFFEYDLIYPVEISGKEIKKIIVNAPNRECFEIHCKLRHILTQVMREQSESPDAKKEITDKEIAKIENKEGDEKSAPTSQELQQITFGSVYTSKNIDVNLVYELLQNFLRKMARADIGLRLDNVILSAINIGDIDGLLGGYIKYFFIDYLGEMTKSQKK